MSIAKTRSIWTKLQFFLHPLHLLAWPLVWLCQLLARLPYAWQLAVGRVFGKICYATGRKYRHIVATNLALCFPELSDDERQQLLVDYFHSAGIGVMEIIMAFWTPKKRLQNLLQVEGLEHLQQAQRAGKGVILLSAHFTMLEICMRLSCEQLDVPLQLVYRKQKNAFFNYLWVKKRRAIVDKLIEHNAIRSMLSSLRLGKTLCYVPDQDFGRKYEHVFAPFFGTPVATITSTSRLAAHTGAAVIMVNYVRLPDAKGYKVSFQPALADFPKGDLVADATTINQCVEQAIQDNPAQYFWHHRRFKTRPAGEGSLYKRFKRKYI